MDRFATHRLLVLAFVACVLSNLPPLMSGAAAADDRILFPIATGNVSGTYYPIGKSVARVISQPPGSRTCEESGHCGVPNLIATAQSSAGSVDNIKAIQEGKVPSGFAQSDIAHAAYHGQGPFAGLPPAHEIRVLANLYLEKLHVVVRLDSGIHTIGDLRGRPVSMDVEGSGTRRAAGIVLAAYGLGPDDIVPAHTTAERASTLMRRGAIDAFFIVAGTPVLAVESLTRDNAATLLPLDADIIEDVVNAHRFFSASSIEDGLYSNVGTVPTFGVGAQWLVSSEVPDQLVYQVCRALWDDSARSKLDSGHPQGRQITLETARSGVAIPVHPGAERCYWDLALQPRTSGSSDER